MKVAIMGAGLSGLACAIELERNGITPWLFEKRGQVGDRFMNGEVFLSILSRPVQDELAYLSEQHRIFLRPVANIKEFHLSSMHQKAVITGNLGFINRRGRHKDALELQLLEQFKGDVHFHSTYTYEQLLRDFTHVVVATGDASYAQAIQSFQVDATFTGRGAIVEGDFSRYTTMCWFNQKFAPRGYGYLIPLSDTEADIALAIPDDGRQIHAGHMDDMWHLFRNRVSADLKQPLQEVDQYEFHRYMTGLCSYPRIGNTFFTGNCLGTLTPLFGFGQFSSILSGIYAAHDLCGISHYEESTKPLRNAHKNSAVVHRYFERMDDHDFDVMVQKLNGFWGKKLFHTRVDVLKWASYGLRILNAARRTL